jgi:glycosyltransferase involved in cell wall biosynthesis
MSRLNKAAFCPGSVPDRVDRIVVHQFDPARPYPGGIDTCLRGIVRYLPLGSRFAFVGVDAGGNVPGRSLGEWEEYDKGSGKFWFMPVARLDPGDQKRHFPHSVRLVLGVLRYYRRLPKSEWLQAHRMDIALCLRPLVGTRTAYFVHTQEHGLTGLASDSFWRFAAGVHKRLERCVVRKAAQVVVFNDRYAEVARKWNPRAQSSPTWFDPDLVIGFDLPAHNQRAVVWVGRLEVPKDPVLAIEAFKVLAESAPTESWRLDIVGSGTLLKDVEDHVTGLPSDIRGRVTLHGRTAPGRVAHIMAGSGVFLMTSHAGYEGYPRVLVEALASGLPAVVTEGADTGNLVHDFENGFVTTRDPQVIAEKIREASVLARAAARASVARLSAPEVITSIYINKEN